MKLQKINNYFKTLFLIQALFLGLLSHAQFKKSTSNNSLYYENAFRVDINFLEEREQVIRVLKAITNGDFETTKKQIEGVGYIDTSFKNKEGELVLSKIIYSIDIAFRKKKCSVSFYNFRAQVGEEEAFLIISPQDARDKHYENYPEDALNSEKSLKHAFSEKASILRVLQIRNYFKEITIDIPVIFDSFKNQVSAI